MKLRSDFVTNSSSSCYVVAFKNMSANLWAELQLPERGEYMEPFRVIASVSSFRKWFIEYYEDTPEWYINNVNYQGRFYMDVEGPVEVYNKGVEYLRQGYRLFVKEINYGSEVAERIFNEQDNNLIIITREA